MEKTCIGQDLKTPLGIISYCLFLIFFSAWFLQAKRRYLNLNYYKQKYDNLYQDVSLRRASRWALLFFPIFLARRFLFVLYPWLFYRKQGF